MTKKLLTGLVFCMALTAVFPILFLICGSFMGNMEIRELLMPVLEIWRLCFLETDAPVSYYDALCGASS